MESDSSTHAAADFADFSTLRASKIRRFLSETKTIGTPVETVAVSVEQEANQNGRIWVPESASLQKANPGRRSSLANHRLKQPLVS
jgi:hypothetical protein